MSDTTTTTEPAPADATAPEKPGRRLRLPGLGRSSGGGSQLFRNAYALMINTGVSAVLGLGFWLLWSVVHGRAHALAHDAYKPHRHGR